VRNGWLDDFEMAALSDFVDEVLRNNPDFQATARRMEAAGYNVKVTRGNLYPSLSASIGVSRRSIQNPFAPSNNVSVGLNARWEVDVWGRLSAQTAASNADFVAAQYDRQGARLSLAAQVAQAWFDVMEAQAQLDLAQKTVESFERAVRIVEKRFARGLSTGLDLRLIVSNYEASRASESSRKNQLGQQKRRLELLAGRYPAASITASGEIPDLSGDVPVGLPVNLLERRPDIQAATRQAAITAVRVSVIYCSWIIFSGTCLATLPSQFFRVAGCVIPPRPVKNYSRRNNRFTPAHY